MSDAIAGPYEQFRQTLQSQAQLYVDESPTKESNAKAWLNCDRAKMYLVSALQAAFAGTAAPSLLLA